MTGGVRKELVLLVLLWPEYNGRQSAVAGLNRIFVQPALVTPAYWARAPTANKARCTGC